MTARVPVRGGSHLRRGRGIRRASAGVSLTRLAALAVVLGMTLVLEYLTGASTFAVRTIEIEGAGVTDRGLVEAALLGAGPARANLFRFDTTAAAARLSALPSVRAAAVRAVLPDRLVATLEERSAVLEWIVGEARFLIDGEGILFAEAPSGGRGTLPLVRDLRAADGALGIGSRLAPVELRAARQLAALTPGSLGSAASRVTVALTDTDGFILTTEPPGWTAVFGLYGDVTRSPDIVPLQVQCLASLLADRGEESFGHVVLSPEGQLCGTFGPP